MTRKEVKVSINMRTNGNIYVCPNIRGKIIVYEDQLVAINSKINRCRTREEANDIIHDFGCGLDLHHSDVQVPTIRKKSARTNTRTTTVNRKPVLPYASSNRVKKSKTQSPTDTQVRISEGGEGVHDLE